MNISDLLDLIEAHDYMAENQISAIRRQHASGSLDTTIEELVQFLLDRQRLTKYQAKKLLSEVKAGVKADSLAVPPGRAGAGDKWASPSQEEDDFGGAAVGDLGGLDGFPTSEEALGEGDPFGLGSGDGFGTEEEEKDPLADQEEEDGKGKKKKKKSGHTKKESRKNPWESPLLLFGGGGLVLLLMVGALLYFWLSFDSGDEMFQAAEQSYRSGSYVQAATEYEKFVKRFPDHPSAPLAEVRYGMSSLWHAVEGGANWESALTTTQTVLPEIETLPAFDEARPELATILPEIAAGLAENAQLTNDLEKKKHQSTLADQAMELVNNPSYLPTSLREAQQSRIDTIEMNLIRVRRDIERDQARNETLVQIEKASSEGKFQEVYQLRRSLLNGYPNLRTDDALSKAVSAAAMTLVDQVKPISDFPVPATNDPAQDSAFAQITFVQHEPNLPADPNSDVAVFRLDGTAYAIELNSGHLLWRRFVGVANDAQAVSWTSQNGQGMAGLIDSTRNQFLALDKRTGKLAWRQEFASELFRPQVLDGAIYLPERDGKVWKLACDTGEVEAAVTLPQQVAAPLGMLSEVAAVYVVAEHSNVFALSTNDLKCVEVIPVGHEVGTITVAPTGTLRHLFLFENAGLEFSFVHLYTVGAGGGQVKLAQDTVRQSGRVVVSPSIADSRVVVTNDRGEVMIYEVNMATKDDPVRLVAATKSDSAEPIIGYTGVDRGTLWVCGNRMTRYVMQLSRGSVVRKMVDHDSDTFVAPPIILGDQIIHARRNSDALGFVVQAQRIAATKLTNIWETTIGTPTAGPAFELEGAKLPLVATSRGTVFDLPSVAEGTSQIVDKPQAKLDVTTQHYQFMGGAAVDPENQVFYPPDDETRSLVVDTTNGKVTARLIAWEIPATARNTRPLLWEKHILVPTKMGQIMVVDPITGASDIHPYQPELAFGEEVDWAPPAPVGGSDPSVILSDRLDNLYRLGIIPTPEPHLAALSQVKLADQMSGSMAVAGLMLVGVGTNDGHDVVRLFQLPEMAEQKPIAITGDVVFSPKHVNGRVYCATSSEGLLAIQDDFSLAWNRPLEGRQIVSGPLPVGDNLAISFQHGEVWLLSAQTGEVIEQFNVGEPLVDGLSWSQGQLWAHGYDGTLHRIPVEGAN
ncbi:hypothetical protein DTL42_00660 [Bremerella cremea]|uniref:Pyrrolo-quinoline quinone repeat domain-containing protein n=1 Tax=Bremerella cremea TaxID=1031537 RepID=A0A368KX73_9BACT|nr:PQQ-binding-like beta-propeller repeat protein [Bremerella cremea]RCS55935.1 hypothetical protein DTL42_00660 [Bremerella cremea]